MLRLNIITLMLNLSIVSIKVRPLDARESQVHIGSLPFSLDVGACTNYPDAAQGVICIAPEDK